MVFVVAEIGVNWDGNFDLAESMMTKAKEYGCNAVKFQSFNDIIVKDHPQKSRLLNSSITKTNVETINELAKSIGIEWFCTPMYFQAIDFLDQYVSRFKVRELDARPLLQGKTTELLELILKTDKDIIVSSQRSPKGTKYYEYDKIRWLYVVPKYPCNLEDLDFRDFRDFNGYSNHCQELIAPVTAAILGAEIIEIHVTADKSRDFFDNNVSFDYNELSELLRMIRMSEKILKDQR